jgi:hypothetical protein
MQVLGLSPSASVSGDMVADTDEGTLASFVNPTIDAGVVPILEPADPPLDLGAADVDDAPAVDAEVHLIPNTVQAGFASTSGVLIRNPVGAIIVVLWLQAAVARRRRTGAVLRGDARSDATA